MLDFRKETVVPLALMQLSMVSHADGNIGMTNFRPESLHIMHLCMSRAGQAARHFSLELPSTFVCFEYPDKAVCYLKECNGKSVVPCHTCITKTCFGFFVYFTFIRNHVSDTYVLGCFFFFSLQTSHSTAV